MLLAGSDPGPAHSAIITRGYLQVHKPTAKDIPFCQKPPLRPLPHKFAASRFEIAGHEQSEAAHFGCNLESLTVHQLTLYGIELGPPPLPVLCDASYGGGVNVIGLVQGEGCRIETYPGHSVKVLYSVQAGPLRSLWAFYHLDQFVTGPAYLVTGNSLSQRLVRKKSPCYGVGKYGVVGLLAIYPGAILPHGPGRLSMAAVHW